MKCTTDIFYVIEKEPVDREQKFNSIVMYGVWIQRAFVKITQITNKLKTRYYRTPEKARFLI